MRLWMTLPWSLVLLVGCTPKPMPEVVPPEPPPPVTSLEDLEAKYSPKLDKIYAMIDAQLPKRDQILSEVRAELAEDREELAGFGKDLERIDERLARKRRRREERQQQLNDLRGSIDASVGESLEQDLTKLDAEIAELEQQRQELRTKQTKLEESVRQRERLDDQGLFELRMQPLFREALELQRRYYDDGTALTRHALADDFEAGLILDAFGARADERDVALATELVSAVSFHRLRRSYQGDRMLAEAVFLANVVQARFPLSASHLELISAEERHDIELLADGLKDKWNEHQRLLIFVDGHADRTRYRGVGRCISATKNLDLSRRRAEAVKEFLGRSLGDASRIEIDWFGNFANRTAGTNKLDDRRIELRIAAAPSNRERSPATDAPGSGSETGEAAGEQPLSGPMVDIAASTSVPPSGPHTAYFGMRNGLWIADRTFIREPGRWVEAGCRNKPGKQVQYLDAQYEKLFARLGIDPEVSVRVDLGSGRGRDVRLGNAFVIADGKDCVEVIPCPDPAHR